MAEEEQQGWEGWMRARWMDTTFLEYERLRKEEH